MELSTLKDIGPWIVGFAALVQVWVIALWKKLRTGKIDLYESGSVEIGYSGLGPSVALTGTLRCLGKDVFIKRILVQVTRKKDAARHDFSWHAFRPNQISLGAQEAVKFELATSFLSTPTQPHRYNILFTESAFLSEYRPKVQPFIQDWQTFVNNKLAETGNTSVVPNLFKEFSDAGKVVNTYSILNNAFYWEEGRYQLTLTVEAANPDRKFTKSWEFVLTQEDSQRLRLNTIAILQTVCGINAAFNFAYPEYQQTGLLTQRNS